MNILAGLANMHFAPLILLYLFAAGTLVYVSVKLSDYLNIIDQKSNISGAFLGGIVLAMVTSLPELFSSLTATVFVKNNNYVLGNVLGSNIFNMLIFALIFFFFYRSMVERKVSKFFLVSMAFAGALYVLVGIGGFVFAQFGWFIGYFNPISLLVAGVYALSVWKTPKIEEAEEEDEEETKDISLRKAVILFVVFALILIGASIFTTYLTDAISVKFNLGASFGGALFLGVATSIPELTSTINLCKKKNFQAAYSDLIGSCIFNFLILAIGDALSFNCPANVYSFDQSSFMMIVFGVIEFIALLIALIILIKGVDANRIGYKIVFYALGFVLVASYTAFLITSNIDLGIAFAPFLK